MADTVDMAAQIEAEHVAHSVARASGAMRVGAAGDCDECGHYMLRLVDGLCGFCRDGRLPPENWVPPVRPANLSPKEPVMSGRSFNLPTSAKTAIEAVESFAKMHDLPMGQAAAQLIERGAAATIADSSDFGPLLAIEDVHLDALLDEVRRRFDRAPDPGAIAALTARAEDAEAKLAGIRAAIG